MQSSPDQARAWLSGGNLGMHLKISFGHGHQLINFWQGKAVFRISPIKAREVYTHSPFVGVFIHHDYVE